jgi:hypothetical protein
LNDQITKYHEIMYDLYPYEDFVEAWNRAKPAYDKLKAEIASGTRQIDNEIWFFELEIEGMASARHVLEMQLQQWTEQSRKTEEAIKEQERIQREAQWQLGMAGREARHQVDIYASPLYLLNQLVLVLVLSPCCKHDK